MRVLGVDPGTYKMGVGVVDSEGAGISYVHADTLSCKRGDALSNRLCSLFIQLLDVIKQWRPNEIAVEEPFAAHNIKAAMAVGQAQAIAMVAGAQNGLMVASYAPRRVKQAVTDHGGSSKEQVRAMVEVLLRMKTPPPSSDASDALAVAICHINARFADHLAILD